MNARHYFLWLPAVALAAAFALLTPHAAAAADCSIAVDFSGSYTPGTRGLPPATRGPSFSEPKITGNDADCDETLTGRISVEISPDADPTIIQVAAAVSLGTRSVDYVRLRVLSEMRQLLGEIEVVGTVALADFLAARGKAYVEEQARLIVTRDLKAGRDPRSRLDEFVSQLITELNTDPALVGQITDDSQLRLRLRRYVEQLIRQLTLPPAETWARASASNSRCSWELRIRYGADGSYSGTHVQKCKGSIVRVDVVADKDGYNPGDLGRVTVRAFTADGTALPLAAAKITGLAAVMADGSSEPDAFIVGAQASFAFAVAKPRRDLAYLLRVEVVTDAASGSFTGTGDGSVVVLNVAPRLESITPDALKADPGDTLKGTGVHVVVVDDNADRQNPAEIQPKTIQARHPVGLKTTPELSASGLRQVSFDPGNGKYDFALNWEGLVERPHKHGTWNGVITASDEALSGLPLRLKLEVNDVPPSVSRLNVVPDFVHITPSRPINITARIEDANGEDDIVNFMIDAREAGGERYGAFSGLVLKGIGKEHRDYELEKTFLSIQKEGRHRIDTWVWDEANNSSRQGFLNVGNTDPFSTATGFLWDNVTTIRAPRVVCPAQLLTVGMNAQDREGDALIVAVTIVETGGSAQLFEGSPHTYTGPLVAPGRPGVYTLLFQAREVTGTRSVSVTHMLEVKACQEEQEQQKPKDRVISGLNLPGGLDDAVQKATLVAARAVGASAVTRSASLPSMFQRLLSGLLPRPAVNAYRPSSVTTRRRVLRPGDVLGALPQNGGASNRISLQLVATGTSAGDFFRLQGLEDLGLREGETLSIPDGLVVQPVKGKIQAAARSAIEKQLPVQGLSIEAYCLDFIKLPPLPGQLYRVAEEKLQQQFAPVTRVLQAARRLAEKGALHPDSNPAGYATAIKQWSLWARLEKWDASAFEKQFVSYMKKNLTEANQPWSKDIEAQVRALVPNRWRDVNAVWSAADSADPMEP